MFRRGQILAGSRGVMQSSFMQKLDKLVLHGDFSIRVNGTLIWKKDTLWINARWNVSNVLFTSFTNLTSFIVGCSTNYRETRYGKNVSNICQYAEVYLVSSLASSITSSFMNSNLPYFMYIQFHWKEYDCVTWFLWRFKGKMILYLLAPASQSI